MELEEAMRHAGAVYDRAVESRAAEALPQYMWTEGRPCSRRGFYTACGEGDIRILSDRSLPDYVINDPYCSPKDTRTRAYHPEWDRGFRAPAATWGGRGLERFTQSGRHLDWGTCPLCGATVQYRSLNMGKKRLQDRIFLIRYVPSRIEENAFVMLGYLVIRDWRRWSEYETRMPETYIDLREICLFRAGKKGERFTKRPFTVGSWDRDGYVVYTTMFTWTHPRVCKGGFDPWRGAFESAIRFVLDEDSVQSALCGTRWESLYQAFSKEDYLDRIDTMERITHYGCAEYLMKLGYETIARAVVTGSLPRGLLNLRGKTAQRVLRVDPDFYGWLKGKHLDLSLEFLALYQAVKRRNVRIGFDQLLAFSARVSPERFERIAALLPSGQLRPCIRYMLRHEVGGYDYMDHLDMMKELEIPWTEESILFPRDFHAVHAELSARRKQKADADAARRMDERTEKLKAWWYSALGLTIRPMLTPEEIIREGSVLRHCVGGYVERYAQGGTILLALRQEEAPGTPWRTVEYSASGHLVQCRGYMNRSPENEQERINCFFKMFDAYRAEYARLNRKKKKGSVAA